MSCNTRTILAITALAALSPISYVTAQNDAANPLHDRFGAPGSIRREQIVTDLRERIARGEISPFKVLLTDALPLDRVANFGGPDANGNFGDKVTSHVNDRGVIVTTFDDDFSSYPRSTDPIFDRFQVNMLGLINPAGLDWDFSQFWYIPSLFVAGQLDPNDPSITDPLPRWQGVTMTENAGLGNLAADLNADGVVDTADLGQLIAVFGSTGAPGFVPADVNLDGVVDTADLGILISEFGQPAGPFCVFLVTITHSIDPDGALLNPTTVLNGPIPGQTIAILNAAYTNDVNADGCPDCASFRILPDGAVNGEQVYGDWVLSDPLQSDLVAVDFKASAGADTCSGWGAEAVMADARGETDIIEEACCFLGARTKTPLFAPTVNQPVIMNCDFYLTSNDTFIRFDTFSTVEGLTVMQIFMGGFAASLTPEFLKYSTGGDGFINHFIFLGNLPGSFSGQFYGTAADPLVGNDPVFVPFNRWFSISMRLTANDYSIWLLDETQYVSNGWVDPDATDGSGTPFDGSDDIDTQGADHWFKIFPTGPAGPSPGVADGQVPEIPQPVWAGQTMDQFRFLWSGDPTNAEVPGYHPSSVFFDNLHVEGVLAPPAP